MKLGRYSFPAPARAAVFDFSPHAAVPSEVDRIQRLRAKMFVRGGGAALSYKLASDMLRESILCSALGKLKQIKF